jgi:WD40 repeat protein
MWDVETGTCKYTLGHSSCVRCIAYSPQNDTIVSAGDSNTARVWDVGTGKYRYTFLGHNVVAYSPRGDQIVSGGRDGSVKVWDTESGDCLWIFIGHRDRVKKVVYSTQGDLVVSTSKDSSMRLWNITSGQCRAVIQDVPAKVSSIAWTEASGVNYLVTGFNNGAVGAWKVQIDEDLCDVSLSWMRTKGVLNMMDATIHDAQGLSPLNRQLLKQRGAVGDPIDRLREASKVTTMASVVSKLKASSNNTAAEDPTLRPSGSLEQLKQLEQLLEQGNDPPFQDIVATIVRIIQRYK